MNETFQDAWRSVIALRQAVRAGHIKPGRDEQMTLILATEIDRLNHLWYDSLIAHNELGGALCNLIDLLPDPHLDRDKVQAHFVRQAKEVLEAFAPKPMEPNA